MEQLQQIICYKKMMTTITAWYNGRSIIEIGEPSLLSEYIIVEYSIEATQIGTELNRDFFFDSLHNEEQCGRPSHTGVCNFSTASPKVPPCRPLARPRQQWHKFKIAKYRFPCATNGVPKLYGPCQWETITVLTLSHHSGILKILICSERVAQSYTRLTHSIVTKRSGTGTDEKYRYA